MTPKAIIHCIRHAQGFHNIGNGNYDIRDPGLTLLGEKQCRQLQETFLPEQPKSSLIVSSPLTRAIHTAFITCQPLLESGVAGKILALPDAQETTDYLCDIGSDLSLLRSYAQGQSWPVDLSLVDETWNVKAPGSRYSPAYKAVKARARDARTFLKAKADELLQGGQDVHIVLVTHGGFLHFFTEDWEDSTSGHGSAWKNCEVRSYTFEQDEDASLYETEQSRLKRGKLGLRPSKLEQQQLFGQAMSGWQEQGLPNPIKIEN